MSDENRNAADEAEFQAELEQEKGKKAKADEFARMLDVSFKKSDRKLSVGDRIKGEILVIGKEEAFVSTGTMHDGMLSRRDLLDEEGNLKHQVGETIDVFVTAVKGSEIRLSTKPTSRNLAEDLEDAFDMMLPVEGRVAEICKGGFRISVHGKLAFCPISQIDTRRVDVPEDYVGKRFEFRITQLTEGGRNIVVSRRKVLEEQADLTQGSFLAEHKAGDVVPGKVLKLEKFGAFIELAPGVDGLAHISELAWSRVNDPKDVVSPGQEINVKILKIENQEGRTRISLSIKQAGEQPWQNLPEAIQPGRVIEGKVMRLAKFGAFIELAPGIEGLLPIGEMSAVKHVQRPQDFVKEGDKIKVQIRDIKPQEQRIGLLLPKEDGGEDWKSYSAAGTASGGLGTFGGALGEQLKKALEKKPGKK